MDGLVDSFQSAPPPGCPDHVSDSLDELLPAPLVLIARDGRAATLATCILLKALFLGLHLLAMRLPECSGMERLALVHWSFDVWNVWCLVVFARTGMLSWRLETCVVYHVLGYLVYSLVYLHLYRREWSKNEALSRMAVTPDSALDASGSVEEEAEGAPGPPGRQPFGTPSRGGGSESGERGEDVPDEEHVTRAEDNGLSAANNNDVQDGERLQAGNVSNVSGRDALNGATEDNGLNGHSEKGEELRKTNGVSENGGEMKDGVSESTGRQNGQKLEDSATPGAEVVVRTYKKLDAAGGSGKPDAPEAENTKQNQEVIEGTNNVKAVKKDQQSASSGATDKTSSEDPAEDAGATGLGKRSPANVDASNGATSGDPARVVDPNGSGGRGLAKSEDGEQTGASDKDDNLEASGDQSGDQNGAQKEHQNGTQKEDQNGDQNEQQSDDREKQQSGRKEQQSGDRKEQQSGDRKEHQNGDRKDQSGDRKEHQSGDRKEHQSGDRKEHQSGDRKEHQSGDRKEHQSGDRKEQQSGDRKERHDKK